MTYRALHPQAEEIARIDCEIAEARVGVIGGSVIVDHKDLDLSVNIP
jgi:hypothetical protein